MREGTPYPDLYEVLEAPRDATTDELTAHRDRALNAAPDPDAARAVADSYAILSRPPSRALYDRLVHGAATVEEPAPTPTRDERPPPELPRDERMVRYIAAAALVVSIVFLVAVLLA